MHGPVVRKDKEASRLSPFAPSPRRDCTPQLRGQFGLAVDHASELQLMWNGFPLPHSGTLNDFLRDGEQIVVQKAPRSDEDKAGAGTYQHQGLTPLPGAPTLDTTGGAAGANINATLTPLPLPSSGTGSGAATPQVAPLPPLLPLNAMPFLPHDPAMALQLSHLSPEILSIASAMVASGTTDPNAASALQQMITEHLTALARQGGTAALPSLKNDGKPDGQSSQQNNDGRSSFSPEQTLAEAASSHEPGRPAGDTPQADDSAEAPADSSSGHATKQPTSSQGNEQDAKRRKLANGSVSTAAVGGTSTSAPGSAAGPGTSTSGRPEDMQQQLLQQGFSAMLAEQIKLANAPRPSQAGGIASPTAESNNLAAALGGDNQGLPAGMNFNFMESMKFLNQHLLQHKDSGSGAEGSSTDASQNAAVAAALEAHLGLLSNAAAAGLVYDGTGLMLPPLLPLAGVGATGGGEGAGGSGGNTEGGDAVHAAASDAAQNYVQMLLSARMPGLEQLAAAAVAAQLAETIHPGMGSGIAGANMFAALNASGLTLGGAAAAAAAAATRPRGQEGSETEDDAPGGAGRRGGRGGGGRGGSNSGVKRAISKASKAKPAVNSMPGLPASVPNLAGIPGFANLGIYGSNIYGLLEGFDPGAMTNSATGTPVPQGTVSAAPSLARSVKLAAAGRKAARTSADGGDEAGTGAAGEGENNDSDDTEERAKRAAGEPGKAARITVGRLKEVGHDMTVARLKEVYHLNIEEAAKELGIGMTKLKEHCRQLGIPRWPSRKLRSMDKLIESLHEQAERDPSSAGMVDEVIKELQHFKDMIYDDPSVEVEEHIKRLRQSNFKKEYQQRQSTKVVRGDEGVPASRHGSRHNSNNSALTAVQAASQAQAQAQAEMQANAAAAAMLSQLPGLADLSGLQHLVGNLGSLGELPGGITLAQLMQGHAALAGLPQMGLPPAPPLVATLPQSLPPAQPAQVLPPQQVVQMSLPEPPPAAPVQPVQAQE